MIPVVVAFAVLGFVAGYLACMLYVASMLKCPWGKWHER
jgi:hypothetical protein